MAEPLPWQAAAWRRLTGARASGRLPHALLVCGPPGVGKGTFVRALAAGLLCERPEPDGTACGGCRACGLYAAGTHPDTLTVTPAEDSTQIVIDQVRELGEFLQFKSQLGGAKVALIDPADKLNAAAANSLLKGLEEPPAGALIILVTDRPGSLPATVRSRCQRVLLQSPPPAEAVSWLQGQGVAADRAQSCLSLAQGVPLRALALAGGEGEEQRKAWFADLAGIAAGRRDPVEAAESWLKSDVGQSLYWLYTWVVDMIRLRSAVSPSLINGDLRQELLHLAQKVDMKALYSRLDQLQEARLALATPLNKHLLLEEVLVAWAPAAPARAGGAR